MRAELIVLLACFCLMAAAAVFCYICLVVASDADRMEEKQMKKNLCVKEVFLPDSKGGWERATPVVPESLDSENAVTENDVPSVSERRLLEKKARDRYGDQD